MPANHQPSMTKDPQPATASEWRIEGDAHVGRNEFDAALHCFDTARALDPADAANYERLAATLTALSRYPEAADRYREAIARNPHNADLHHGLGWTLELMHRLDDAIDAYREAVRHNPRADGSNNNMGNCLQALGRFDEAHEAYRRAITGAPRVPLYYRNFVQTKRLSVDDPVFASLRQLVGESASLSVADQAEAHFAYGQALSDVGRNDDSFDHQLKGNALHRAGVRYNEADSLGLFAQMPTLINADVLAAARGLGDPSAAPIFVIGMPRSGSTLIEQILASHPQVFGAGERTEFGEALVKSICRPAGRSAEDRHRGDAGSRRRAIERARRRLSAFHASGAARHSTRRQRRCIALYAFHRQISVQFHQRRADSPGVAERALHS